MPVKAAVHTRYGSPDVVEVKQVEKPCPKDDEILIKVHAASINDFDWGIISGKPYFIRIFLGLFKPKIQISGCDIAGQVEAVGKDITQWQTGDGVYGDLSGGRFGGFAEYVCCKENQVGRKPSGMSYIEAAGIPQAAVLAWQGLTVNGPLQDGQQILINGAGGGVGTYGVQLAKQKDIEVTGVDSAEKLDFMRSVGFDQVIDYKKEDFTRCGKRYDLILDTKTNRGPFAYTRALKPNGLYATVGGSMPHYLTVGIMGPVLSWFTGKKLKVIALKPNFGLDYFNQLFEAGEFKSAIDGPYKFDDLVEALHYYVRAEHKGKIIITMD